MVELSLLFEGIVNSDARNKTAARHTGSNSGWGMLGYRFRVPHLYCVARDLSWDVGSLVIEEEKLATGIWMGQTSQARYTSTRAPEVQMLPLSFPDLDGQSLPQRSDENQQVKNRDQ